MLDDSYRGKRVLITGGGRGLGRAMALAFSERGADVALAGRTVAQLEGTAADVRSDGGIAHPLPVDLYDVDAATSLVERAVDAMGDLDILVNNAGGWNNVAGAVGPVRQATVEGFDAIYRLNVRSPLFTTIAAAEHMIATGHGGAILNIVSVDGIHPAPTEALYGSAKAAVINLTQTLSYEYGIHKIRINAIAPGIVETNMTAPWLATHDERTERESFYPLGRIGQPEDVAHAALYLCSAAASWVTGVTLPVCGGQYATSDIFRWVRANNPVPESMRI